MRRISAFWLAYVAGLVELDPAFAARDKVRETPDWVAPYLACVAAGLNIRESSEIAGVTEAAVYNRRQTCPDFERAERDARRLAMADKKRMGAIDGRDPEENDPDMLAWLRLSDAEQKRIVAEYCQAA